MTTNDWVIYASGEPKAIHGLESRCRRVSRGGGMNPIGAFGNGQEA